MGREIRRVPPNWKHPRNEAGHLQPMFDRTFAEASQEWKDQLEAWERGERPSYFHAERHPADYQFWEYDGGPPDNREYYRPYTTEEATWFQLWETVSEGTPVTPPFATKEELAQYLAENGDEWDQLRSREGRFGYRHGEPTGWGIERARAFVDAGGALSGAFVGGQFLESKDIPLYESLHADGDKKASDL